MIGSSAMLVRSDDARREKARREKARRYLVDFMEYVSPWYHAAAHHRKIAEKLEQVELFIRSKGKEGIGRLLISVPPRHGKTEMVSRHFPAWILGRLPDTRVILASYGANLATDNSRSARGLVMNSKYLNVFGIKATVDVAVELSSDSRSVEAWDLASPNRGGVVATGVGGGITGKGAHLMIIDDPFKNRKEAESEAYRRDVWEWWTSTARTRLEDGGTVIGMFTRWHADDWAGRLLRNMATNRNVEQWQAVTMMALWEPPVLPEGKTMAEFRSDQQMNGAWVEEEDPLGRQPGEALWPEKYSAEDLALIKDAIGPYDWEALYQQRPYSRTGNLFRREWFAIIEETPANIVKRVRYWDKAATAGGGAFSCGVLMGMTDSGLIVVEDVRRGQWSAFEREEEIQRCGLVDQKRAGAYTVIHHEQEPGSSGKDSAQATNEKMARAGLEAHFEPVTGDKVVRAGPWSSSCEAGKVRLVRGGWNDAYIEEHLAFPMGRLKDQVDASSGAHNKLNDGLLLDGQLMF